MIKMNVIQHTAVVHLDHIPKMSAEIVWEPLTHKQLIEESSLMSSVDHGQTTVSTLLNTYSSYVKQKHL